MDFTLTDEQFADPELKKMIADSIVSKAKESGMIDLIESGVTFISIKQASEISPFSMDWIRNNLKYFKAEGINDQIRLSTITQAIKDREVKR